MPPLVQYGEQCQFLDVEFGTDKDLLEALLAEATTLFEKSCGRDRAPFAGALTGRVEIHEGDPGSSQLWLDYPISTVTSIGLGRDVAMPTETLGPADTSQVVWRVGGRLLTRTDGSVWRRGPAHWIKVVYDTLDDRPADVQLAIKRMVARIYQHRGKEGFTSLTRGSRSWTIAEGEATQDPFWQQTIGHYQRSWVR